MGRKSRTEIEKKYKSLGKRTADLGRPEGPEGPTADGCGFFQDYVAGSIYSVQGVGTFEVHGAIWQEWLALDREHGDLGYPTSDEQEAPDGKGRFSNFQRGAIYYYPGLGAHEVRSPLLERWLSFGAELGQLGYPVGDRESFEKLGEGACYQQFQHGVIHSDLVRDEYVILDRPEPGPCDEASGGRWRKNILDSNVVGIHAALLREAKVLFFSHGDPPEIAEGEQAIEVGSAVLDFSADHVTQQKLDPGVICSGHTFLPDGRLVVCGSEREGAGVNALRLFDPEAGKSEPGGSRAWQHLENLTEVRWYPTCVELPDGRIIVVGGQRFFKGGGEPNATYQVFDPSQGMLPPKPLPLLREEGGMYPFTFVLPSRKLLIHAGRKTCFLDLKSFAFEDTVLEAAEREGRNSRTYDLQGTAVLLPLRPEEDYRARVMLLGGGGAPPVTADTPATDTCEILDLGEAEPAWRLGAPMARRRVMPDAVLLPDGNLLVTNGSSTGKANAGANPVFEAEVYDVETGTWTTLCSMQIPRLYHSVALLLPDGRVLTAGEDSVWHPASFTEAKLDIEIFSPPYLFRGRQPILRSLPSEIVYGDEFKVSWTGDRNIKSAALISPASVTHSFNSHQRYVGLEVLGPPSNNLTLRAPRDEYVAPPGHYMLFLVDEAGVPSHARFVHLGWRCPARR